MIRANEPLPSAVQPSSLRNGMLAPALMSASTPSEPSAFITTTDQSPSSISQSTVWVPAPWFDAAQMSACSGDGVTLARVARVVGVE